MNPGDSRPIAAENAGSTRRRRRALVALIALSALVSIAVAACGPAKPSATNPLHLNKPGTLSVGMTLQFRPEMYLRNGKPAGYDILLLNALAKQMHVKLEIKNLDFTGLIPGLVAMKFDMISVGLTPTPARAKSVTFSRSYVPYVQVLADRTNDPTPATIAAWNRSDKTITSLEGSTAEQRVQSTFPGAHSHSFPDQNAAFLEVATSRADGIVVETYLLAQFNKSNGNTLQEVPFPKPLHVEYGSYAVQKGNTALARYLDTFICKEQKSGELARFYMATMSGPLKAMPSCP